MAQRYGFEIECFGLTRDQLREALADVDGSTYQSKSGNDIYGYYESKQLPVRGLAADCPNGKVWIAARDGTIHNSSGRGIAHEIISPVLHGVAGLAHLKKIMKALKRAGATINATCGLHITFDLNHNSRMIRKSIAGKHQVLLRLVEAYDYFWAEGFCALVPSSRRQGMPNYNGYAPRPNITNSFVGENTNFRAYNLGRGCVNLGNYGTNGTVEFRQHGGTMNGHKIETFALLVHRLSSWAMNENHPNFGKDLRTFSPDIDGLLEMLNETGTVLGGRVRTRRDEVLAANSTSRVTMPCPVRRGYRNQFEEYQGRLTSLICGDAACCGGAY